MFLILNTDDSLLSSSNLSGDFSKNSNLFFLKFFSSSSFWELSKSYLTLLVYKIFWAEPFSKFSDFFLIVFSSLLLLFSFCFSSETIFKFFSFSLILSSSLFSLLALFWFFWISSTLLSVLSIFSSFRIPVFSKILVSFPSFSEIKFWLFSFCSILEGLFSLLPFKSFWIIFFSSCSLQILLSFIALSSSFISSFISNDISLFCNFSSFLSISSLIIYFK